jgi:hypothetical protein
MAYDARLIRFVGVLVVAITGATTSVLGATWYGGPAWLLPGMGAVLISLCATRLVLGHRAGGPAKSPCPRRQDRRPCA